MIGWDPSPKEQFPLFCPNCYSEEIMGIIMPKPENLEGLPVEEVEHEGRAFQAVAGFLCFDCKQLSFTDGSSMEAPPQLVEQAEAEKNRKLEAGEIEHTREASNDWADEQIYGPNKSQIEMLYTPTVDDVYGAVTGGDRDKLNRIVDSAINSGSIKELNKAIEEAWNWHMEGIYDSISSDDYPERDEEHEWWLEEQVEKIYAQNSYAKATRDSLHYLDRAVTQAQKTANSWDDPSENDSYQLSFGPFMNCPDCDVPFEVEIEDNYYPEAYPMQWMLRCPECENSAPGYAGWRKNYSPEYQQALDFAASQDNTPEIDYASALSVLPDNASVWRDLVYNQDLAENILEIAKRRNEIPELINAYGDFREEVLESFRELEEMNWEYLSPHPEYDSEYIDENGDVTDDWYESPSYRSAEEDLEREHPGMQALNKIWSLLEPYIETVPNQRQAAATTKKLLEQKAQIESELGPDNSFEIARDEEGWSIKQPQTYADVNRIGCMMGNCWALTGSDEYLSDIYDLHPERPGTDPVSFKESDPDLNMPIEDSVMFLSDPNGIPRLAWNALEGGFQDILGRHNSDPKPEYIARINSLLENTEHSPQMVLAPSSEYTPWPADAAEVNGITQQDDSMLWQNYVDAQKQAANAWENEQNEQQSRMQFCPECGVPAAHIIAPLNGVDAIGCLNCETEFAYNGTAWKMNDDMKDFWEGHYWYQKVPFPDKNQENSGKVSNAWDEEPFNVQQMSMADDMLVRQLMTIPEYADEINAKIAENEKQMEGLAAAFEIPVDEFRARPGVQALLLGPVEVARSLFPVLFAQNEFPELNDTWAQDKLDKIWQTQKRTAAETGAQALQRAQSLETILGPDESQIVHQFDDGWTIRQLSIYADAEREGHLMSNCMRWSGEDESASFWGFHPNYQTWEDPEFEDLDMPLPSFEEVYSLRDPNNIPHVTIYEDEITDGRAMLGKHNSNPKPEYLDKIEEWVGTQNYSRPSEGLKTEIEIYRNEGRTANTPDQNTYYHVAPRDQIRNILTEGLSAHDDGTESIWGLGKWEDNKGNYLFGPLAQWNGNVIPEYKYQMEGRYNNPFEILEVNLTPEQIERLERDPEEYEIWKESYQEDATEDQKEFELLTDLSYEDWLEEDERDRWLLRERILPNQISLPNGSIPEEHETDPNWQFVHQGNAWAEEEDENQLPLPNSICPECGAGSWLFLDFSLGSTPKNIDWSYFDSVCINGHQVGVQSYSLAPMVSIDQDGGTGDIEVSLKYQDAFENLVTRQDSLDYLNEEIRKHLADKGIKTAAQGSDIGPLIAQMAQGEWQPYSHGSGFVVWDDENRVQLGIDEYSDRIELGFIEADPEGQGNGTHVLNAIKSYASQRGLPVIATGIEGDNPTSYFQSQGFVSTEWPEDGGFPDQIWQPADMKTAAQNIYYHIAPTIARDKIAQEGITPWEEGRPITFEHLYKPEPYVYLFDNQEDAIVWMDEFADHYEDTPEGNADLWEINAQLEVERDNRSALNAYITKQAIPPENINLIDTISVAEMTSRECEECGSIVENDICYNCDEHFYVAPISEAVESQGLAMGTEVISDYDKAEDNAIDMANANGQTYVIYRFLAKADPLMTLEAPVAPNDIEVYDEIYPERTSAFHRGIHSSQDLALQPVRKTTMAADPEWLNEWIATNGPYVYHGAHSRTGKDAEEVAQDILANGIMPNGDGREQDPWPGPVPEGVDDEWEGYDPGSPHDQWWLTPRQDHVYMAVDPRSAYGEPLFRVDLTKLDPALINPDEDVWRDTWPDHLVGPYEGDKSLGEQAHEYGLGDNPEDTHGGIAGQGTMAYNGTIPSEAIERVNPADVEKQWVKKNSALHSVLQPIAPSPKPPPLHARIAHTDEIVKSSSNAPLADFFSFVKSSNGWDDELDPNQTAWTDNTMSMEFCPQCGNAEDLLSVTDPVAYLSGMPPQIICPECDTWTTMTRSSGPEVFGGMTFSDGVEWLRENSLISDDKYQKAYVLALKKKLESGEISEEEYQRSTEHLAEDDDLERTANSWDDEPSPNNQFQIPNSICPQCRADSYLFTMRDLAASSTDIFMSICPNGCVTTMEKSGDQHPDRSLRHQVWVNQEWTDETMFNADSPNRWSSLTTDADDLKAINDAVEKMISEWDEDFKTANLWDETPNNDPQLIPNSICPSCKEPAYLSEAGYDDQGDMTLVAVCLNNHITFMIDRLTHPLGGSVIFDATNTDEDALDYVRWNATVEDPRTLERVNEAINHLAHLGGYVKGPRIFRSPYGTSPDRGAGNRIPNRIGGEGLPEIGVPDGTEWKESSKLLQHRQLKDPSIGVPEDSKTAALTRQQLLEMAADLGQDSSRVLAELADGWTIRAPMTLSDYNRESGLMSNCIGPILDGPDELFRSNGEILDWRNPDHRNLVVDDLGIASLRDPDNIPRLMGYANRPNVPGKDLVGRNNSWPKEEYWNRWNEYEDLGAWRDEATKISRNSLANLWEENDDVPLPNSQCPECSGPAYEFGLGDYEDDYEQVYFCPSCLKQYSSKGYYYDFEDEQQLHEEIEYFLRKHEGAVLKTSGTPAWEPADGTPERTSANIPMCPSCGLEPTGEKGSQLYCEDCDEAWNPPPGGEAVQYSGPPLYHFSPAANREAIQQSGLMPNREGVFLTVDPDYWTDMGLRSGQLDLWEIDANGLDLYEDHMDAGAHLGKGHYVFPGTIPAERIKLSQPLWKESSYGTVWEREKPNPSQIILPTQECRTIACPNFVAPTQTDPFPLCASCDTYARSSIWRGKPKHRDEVEMWLEDDGIDEQELLDRTSGVLTGDWQGRVGASRLLPEVIESYDDPADPADLHHQELGNRRPFYFVPSQNRIYLAPLGGHHFQLEEDPDYSRRDDDVDSIAGEFMTYEGWDFLNENSALDLGPRPKPQFHWLEESSGGARVHPVELEANTWEAEQALMEWANQKGLDFRLGASRIWKQAMPLSPDSPGMPEYFYHVAPAEHHGQIMKQGLIPGQEDTSPWTADRQEWNFDFDAPSGVYLWDNLDHARQYAHVLASKAHDLPEFPDEWQDRYPDWFVDPEDPYWEEEGMEPPEPEQPPSWNIYYIPAGKVTDLRMDPEAWQKWGEISFEEAMSLIEDDEFPETTEGHRYYTPNPISPNDIRLVETRSLADMGLYDYEQDNSDWAEGSYDARVPEVLTRVPDLLESPLANPNWPKEAADIPQGEKVFDIRQPFLMDNEGNMVIGYMGTHHEDLDPDYAQEVFGLSDEAANNINYWQSVSPLEGHILWLDDGPHIQWPSAVDASRWSFEEKLLDYAKSVREEGEWINRGAPRSANTWDSVDEEGNRLPDGEAPCNNCGAPTYHMPGHYDDFFLCSECNHVSHEDATFPMPKKEIAEDIEEHGWSRFKRNSKVLSIWDREVTFDSNTRR